MAVSHVKSNIVADFTGTVTVFNSVGATTTTQATALVRPSDWNSAHNQFMTISGNTVGVSTVSGTNIVFQGGNNITLSGTNQTIVFSGPDLTQYLTTAAQSNHSHGNPTLALTNINGTTASNSAGLTLSLSAVVPAQSVQTQSTVAVQGSTGAISFGNANGVTFGFNASTITASHNGLTTARASNDAVGLGTALTAGPLAWTVNSAGLSLNAGSAAGTGFTSTTTAGTAVVATQGTNGLSMGIPAFLTAAAGGGGPAISAAGGSQSTGTVVFSNSNGVSFGFNAGTITATVNPGAAAGIAAIQASNTTYTSGTVNFSNANGITFGSSAPNAVTISHELQFTSATSAITSNALNTSASRVINIVAATNNTAGGAASLSGNVSFSAANGLTFYTSAGGAIVGSHNALTTARASNDAVGLNTALTAGPLAWTVNSAGISLNASSAAGTTSGFAGNLISGSMTHNTAGLNLSLSHPAWLTTAAQSSASNVSAVVAATNNTGGGTATLSGAVSFTNANSVTFYTSAGNAIALSLPAYLTTARASTDAVGLATAQTNVTWTVNSAGISLNGAGYAGTGTSATNASITLNSNGLAISVAAPGGGGGAAFSAGTQSVSTGTVNFANSNGITFGMSNSNQITASYNSTQFAGLGTTFQGNNASGSMTLNSAGLNLSVSVAAPGAAAENNAINLLGANTAGNTTVTGSTIGMSGVNITLSGTNASQLVISAPATSSLVGLSGLSVSTNGSTINVYQVPTGNMEVYELGNNTAFSTMGQGTIYFQQFIPKQNATFENIERRFSGSSVSSTNSQVAAHTYSYGLYSRETGASSSRYTQIAASSIYFAASFNSNTQAGWTVSQGAGSVTNTSAGTVNLSAITGFKHIYFPFAGTVTEGGQYAVAMWMSSATTVGTSPLRIGLMEMTNINNLTIGRLDTAAGFSISNASRIGDFGQGVYSSSSSNLPASIALSGFTNAVSLARMYLQLD